MKRALISVFHKENIEKIAAALIKANWEIISTGGTAAHLRSKGIPVTEVSRITNFPEILDGRVKTLHPLIFGPVLAKKTADHLRQLEEFQTAKIDLVIINFYPFEEALEKTPADQDAMLENIDIGGPALVRAAAKNFHDTIVLIDEKDYAPVIAAVESDSDIPLSRETTGTKSLCLYLVLRLADRRLPACRRGRSPRFFDHRRPQGTVAPLWRESPPGGLPGRRRPPLSFLRHRPAPRQGIVLQQYPRLGHVV